MTYKFYDLGKEKTLQFCLADATTSGTTPVGTYYDFSNLSGSASSHVSISGNVLTLSAGRYFVEGHPYRNNKGSTLDFHFQWEKEVDSVYSLTGDEGTLNPGAEGFRKSAAYFKVDLTQNTNFKLKITLNTHTTADTVHGYIQIWRES